MPPSLNDYIDRRLDGVKGEIPQLVHMLTKAFTSPSFRAFWTVWNPLYSYVLTYYVYLPARRLLPRPPSVLITFLVSGLFHDFIVYLLLGQTTFKIVQVFFVYALVVVCEPSAKKLNMTRTPTRVTYNLFLLTLPVVFVSFTR